MEGGGGARYAAHQEQRDRPQVQGKEEEEEEKPRAGGGAGMKFRVSARAPHGVGALLLIGGAVVAGAAVVAWRHARRQRERGPQPPPPPKAEVSDGGVVEEDGKCGTPAPEMDHTPVDNVQGAASPQEIDQPDDDNRRAEEEEKEIDQPGGDSLIAEEEKADIGPNEQDNGGVAQEEIQEVHDDPETVADDEVVQNSEERAEKVDLDSSRSPTEISTHDDAVREHVDKTDQNLSTKLPGITVPDSMDTVTVENVDEESTDEDNMNDQNPTKNDTNTDQEDPIMNLTENGHDQATNVTDTDQEDPIMNHTESENSSENDVQKEMAPIVPVNEDVEEACDQCTHNVSRPEIVLNKQSLHGGDGAQEAESMENSPTAQLMMHPEQLLDDMTNDAEEEAGEAKVGEGTASDKDDVPEQQDQQVAEPVGLSTLLVKPTEKKELEVPGGGGRFETGMKVEQDYINGWQKENGLIKKGGGTPGGAVMAMDRRSSSKAVLALMFALTIGIAIVVRLYAPPRDTKFQLDLQ